MCARTVFKTLILIAAACSFSLGADALNSGVTYQGRILKPDGTPLSGASTQFKLQIRTPDSQSCLFYEEIQSLDLRNSNGAFSLTMNDGSGSRTDASGYTLDQVFANHGTFNFSLPTCSVGPGAYVPAPADGRNLVVLFKDETMATWEPMPAQKINFVPFAFEAKQVSGFTVNNIVRVAEADGTLDTVSPLSNANYTELLALIAGTSAQYTKQSAGAGSVVTTVGGGGNVASPAAGSVWLDTTAGNLKFYDGATVKTVGTSGGSVSSVATGAGLTGGPITASGTIALATLGAGGTGVKVTYDIYGRVTAAVALVEADIPTLSAAGKVVGSAITSGTIGGSTAINTTGPISSGAMSTQSVQVFETTNTYKVTLQSSASLHANYALTLPPTAGSPNQVLTTNGAGLLTWTSPSSTSFVNGGNTFGANATIGTNDNFRLDVKTNNAVAMTVLPSGFVGIGTTAPTSPLTVVGAVNATSYQILNNNFLSGDVSTGTVAAGIGALSNQFGWEDVAVGRFALSSELSSGFFNTAVGGHAAQRTTGFMHTSVGYQAAQNLTYTEKSTFLGAGAGTGDVAGFTSNGLTILGTSSGAALQSGSHYNTFVGASSGGKVTTGAGNTFVGGYPVPYNGTNVTTGSFNVGLGFSISMPSATASNQLNIGNAIFATGMTGTVAAPAGNVGIGTTSPRGKLDVSGAMISSDPSATAGSTVDFSTGNLQYTTSSCGSFQLNYLKSGASYSFAVQGAASALCSFTAYSDAGATPLTVHLPPGHGVTVASTHTLYTLMIMGTHVYVSWVTGY